MKETLDKVVDVDGLLIRFSGLLCVLEQAELSPYLATKACVLSVWSNALVIIVCAKMAAFCRILVYDCKLLK